MIIHKEIEKIKKHLSLFLATPIQIYQNLILKYKPNKKI